MVGKAFLAPAELAFSAKWRYSSGNFFSRKIYIFSLIQGHSMVDLLFNNKKIKCFIITFFVI